MRGILFYFNIHSRIFFCLLCKHVRIGKAKIIIAFPSDSSTLIFKWIHYRKSLHYRKSHSKENRTFDFVLFQGTNRKLCICFSQSSGIFCHFYNHYFLPFFFQSNQLSRPIFMVFRDSYWLFHFLPRSARCKFLHLKIYAHFFLSFCLYYDVLERFIYRYIQECSWGGKICYLKKYIFIVLQFHSTILEFCCNNPSIQ